MSMALKKNKGHARGQNYYFDKWLLIVVLSLLVIGLIMVTSASVLISEKEFRQPFHFLIHQCLYILLGFLLAAIIVRLPLKYLEQFSFQALLCAYLLLFFVLVPGIGREVNGSMRWLGFGPIGFQVSEIAKLLFIIFMADYLTRRYKEVQTEIKGFVKPMMLLAIFGLLLLKEPDFGATAVITATVLGMMFLAGVRFWQFLILLTTVGLALAALAISSPYRLARLTSFLNPWSTEFNTGYQLTQALIAFGRGGWYGVGLGDSIQKLFYLPEAHTDFLFAIIAEELGLIGVFVLITLFCIVVTRSLLIARRAFLNNKRFNAFLGYGLALWLALQTMINIGVNSGLLPTKGLTLPFLSYGGSSMLVMLMVLALLFRIDFENRIEL